MRRSQRVSSRIAARKGATGSGGALALWKRALNSLQSGASVEPATAALAPSAASTPAIEANGMNGMAAASPPAVDEGEARPARRSARVLWKRALLGTLNDARALPPTERAEARKSKRVSTRISTRKTSATGGCVLQASTGVVASR